MRYFLVAMGIIVVIILVLGLATGSVRADGAATTASESNVPFNGMLILCLVLIGGAVLLAGSMWVGMLRRMSS